MKRILLILSASIILLSIYASPSFATNVQSGGSCNDVSSYCKSSLLSCDTSNCKQNCIKGNTCYNWFGQNPYGQYCSGFPLLGCECWYLFQDPDKPSCGECGVPTCSGLSGWWCKPDDIKCSGGKVCDASNKCSCPSGTSWDGTKCSIISPPIACTNPSQYQNSNNCNSGGCYWCAPPAYSGYCAASSSDCTSPCTYKADSPKWNDDQCKDSCESNGCNLRINVCTTGGTCGFSGTSKFCQTGKSCDKAVECYASTGACGASGGGGSSWYSPTFSICSSGCPTSYPNQQWVACDAIGGCNPGTSGCASYDPIKGETPCCTAGGYYTCDKNEVCKPTGCVDICTDPATDKNAEPYCSKCNSCQDGVQNCGEPSVDKCEAFCMF